MDSLPPALSGLAAYPQFIVYALKPSRDNPDKLDKIPIDIITDRLIDAHNPTNWMSAEGAIIVANLAGDGYGVGFVITENDPFFLFDIDHCLTDAGWSQQALDFLNVFAGAAVEVSSSGKALHIIGRVQKPIFHKCNNKEFPGLELYTKKRFIALTGNNTGGSVDFDCSSQVNWLVANYLETSSTEKTQGTWESAWTCQPNGQWNGPADDELLIERMLKSQSITSALNGKASFKDLWENNIDVLAVTYPNNDDLSKGAINYSHADAALAQHLAFWTGNNYERMKNLMLRSKLVRDKWNRDDYLGRTIHSACTKQMNWLQDKKPTDSDSQPSFLNFEQQLELFKDCVYVEDENAVLVPGGYLLNEARFKVRFGGHSFPMDLTNSKVIKNAWEAFTETQVLRGKHKRARTSVYRPLRESRSIFIEGGQTCVNFYEASPRVRKSGDATLFKKHLEKLFRDERDIAIITSYMAACIRYVGVKFRWCPLIQGIQGNGKTRLAEIINFGIGDRHCHPLRPDSISKHFNKWLGEKCFAWIDEVCDPKRIIIESLKPMITDSRHAIEPKGVDQVIRIICCNFLLFTNYKDGLQKHSSDRRLAPFFTHQQYAGDLERDGLDTQYFRRFNHWLDNEDGFAITCDYLDNYAIPDEFNPATFCQRAPQTSATAQAIEEGSTTVEQEILEAIGQELPGFKKGWISSLALNNLIKQMPDNLNISLNKRRELLRHMGYDWHPGLPEGRVNNKIMPDAGKPRLFIIKNHPLKSLTLPTEIARAYEDAQK